MRVKAFSFITFIRF